MSIVTVEGNATVERGATLKIRCVSRAPRRQSSYLWYLNSRRIDLERDNKKGFELEEMVDPMDRYSLIGELTAMNVTDDHAGLYFCRTTPDGKYKRLDVDVVEPTCKYSPRNN